MGNVCGGTKTKNANQGSGNPNSNGPEKRNPSQNNGTSGIKENGAKEGSKASTTSHDSIKPELKGQNSNGEKRGSIITNGILDELLGKAPARYIEDEGSKYDKKPTINEGDALTKNNQGAELKEERKRGQKKKKVGEGPESEEITENVKILKDKKLSKKDLETIIKSLMSHHVFYSINETQMEYIVQRMFYCEATANSYVFKQGDEKATSFFILEKGELFVEINGEKKHQIKTGSSFGELAMLYSAPRSASIFVQSQSFLWGMDRMTFRKTLEEISSAQFSECRKFLDGISFFSSMTHTQKDAIANALSSQKFNKGDDIVREGDQASSYYIIQSGQVSCMKGDKEVRRLVAGDTFGEQALYFNSTRTLTVRAAVNDTKVLALGRDELTRILGGKVQQIIYKNWQRWAYEKTPELEKLTKLQVEKLIECASYQNKSKGDVILSKNAKCQQLVILIEGSAVEAESNAKIPKGQMVGSKYLSTAKKEEKVAMEVTMETDGVISVIEFEMFFKTIGGSLEEVLKKNENSHEKKLLNADMSWKKEVENLTLENLIFIKNLGEGQFGQVVLCKEAKKPRLYALKSVSKARVVSENLQTHTIAEKMVLEQISNPFIMSMYRTFKNDQSVFFMLEFVEGMELFDVIREIGYLNNGEAKFYVSSMILAIEYLHYKKIIYRDLKPENIMIDVSGYLKMIDLGTAKILQNSNGGYRTATLLGTPHYMAPEIFEKKGYSFNVDLWSVGVCLFEFMVGFLPFGDDSEDPFEVYKIIVTSRLEFPKQFLTKENKMAKSMIEQLLSKTPESRLGGSFAALKAHQWFNDLDWVKLLQNHPHIL